VLLSACSDDQEFKREVYSSKDRCIEDWGSEDRCESSGSGYLGPRYYWRSGKPYYFPPGSSDAQSVSTGRFASMRQGDPSSNSITSMHTSVSRGGFGYSSSFHGSGLSGISRGCKV